ncbi:MAG: hypothetical protein NT086_12425 [Proteobacteria bacterium]|nr:hypothetical protein [Pseudomonadota bacterium]
MAGILETIVGAATGGAGYLAASAKAEQSWKDKDEYQQAKLDAQKQLFGDRLDQQRDMFNQRMANSGGGGRGSKGAALPKTEEDLMQVAASSGIPLPRIKEYLDHIRSGQMPTENQPIEVDDEGARINGLLSDGRVPDEVGKTFMEHQVPDQAAAQRINGVREDYGDAVLRTLSPDDYGSVMKGDEQRSMNGILQAAINSKHPRAIESLAAWNRALKGEGNYSSGENVITGKPSEKGNREVVVKEQNGATNAKEAEIKDEKARFERSPEGIGSKRDYRRDEVFRAITTRQEDLKIVMRELENIISMNKGDKDPAYIAKQQEVRKIKNEIVGLRNELNKPSKDAPAPRNFLTDPIPKVGG